MSLRNFAEAAAELNVRESWLREKVAAREVPHTRLGRHVRFTDEDLARIVSDGHQEPTRRTPVRHLPHRAAR